MQSFFKDKTMAAKEKKKIGCKECGLDVDCKIPNIKPRGKGEKKILIISDCPGKSEDTGGKPLQHPGGVWLKNLLKNKGIEVQRDCWVTYGVRCRPRGYKKPTAKQINCCRDKVLETIAELKPEKILIVGKLPLTTILGHRMKNLGTIEKWDGFAIPDQDLGAWVFPVLSPGFLLKEDDDLRNKMFVTSINHFVKHKEPFPHRKDEIQMETDEDEICLKLKELRHVSCPIAFDYETTGLKPHTEGHDIRCVAVSWKNNMAFAFPLEDSKVRDLWKKILSDPNTKKIAHNAAYENKWSEGVLGVKVKGWIADTMLTTHVLDNRSSICGLKFQTYVRYGVLGYDESMGPFLKTDGKNCNDKNKVFDAPINDLLKYCGMDAMFTYRLWEDQQKELRKSINHSEANKFFFDGLKAIMSVESNGIRIDTDYYVKHVKHLARRIKGIERRIAHDPLIQEFKEKEEKDFNPNSPAQVSKIITDYLGVKDVKKTATGKASSDQETLESLKDEYPIMSTIVDLRKKAKLKSTYVEPFVRESPTGFLYPDFLLHRVQTYRSSSANPNFQNIPKRDKEAQKITRSGIHPRPGRQLMEVDYSGIEVRIGACYHKDPVMIDYIVEGGDMHKDVAADIFMLDPEDVTPEQRHCAKNQFVFPQFYGDWYKSCAVNLWKSAEADPAIMDQLNDNGIHNYQRFENRVQKAEDIFWNKRFKVYTQWKENALRRYAKTKKIELKTGFTCTGFMKKNDVLNYPIQGSAFHCLLWSLTKLQKKLTRMKFDTLIIGQIHDSIILDIVPDELEELKPIIRKIMCEDIREHWDWIIVPMDIEADISDIDGNWFDVHTLEI